MLKNRYLCSATVVLVTVLTFGCGGTGTNQSTTASTPTTTPTPATSPTVTIDFSQYTGNRPFKLNTLPTTSYGPAWADIVVEKSNFLECKGASIALCYYSGPGPTTPCTFDGKGVANCTCYQIPAGEPYLVDINAILNLDVYLETVEQCGKDGSKCKPTGSIEAPVCEAVNNNTLIPGADLISTFSTYLEKQIHIDPTTCSTPAAYAGCMTAPCKQTGKTDPNTGLPLVQCGCPTFTGPYQVGTKIEQDQCVLGSPNIWSAAYQVPSGQ
jgi:hypothetical protein